MKGSKSVLLYSMVVFSLMIALVFHQAYRIDFLSEIKVNYYGDLGVFIYNASTYIALIIYSTILCFLSWDKSKLLFGLSSAITIYWGFYLFRIFESLKEGDPFLPWLKYVVFGIVIISFLIFGTGVLATIKKERISHQYRLFQRLKKMFSKVKTREYNKPLEALIQIVKIQDDMISLMGEASKEEDIESARQVVIQASDQIRRYTEEMICRQEQSIEYVLSDEKLNEALKAKAQSLLDRVKKEDKSSS